MMAIARKHIGFVAWPTVIATTIALVAVAASCAVAVAGHWPYWTAFLFNSYMFLILFMGVHEALHNAVGGDDPKYKLLNDAVGWVCGIVALIPYRGYDRTHMVHHLYTNDPEKDPDYWCKARSLPIAILKALTLKFAYTKTVFRLGLDKQPGGAKRAWISNTHDLAPLLIIVVGFWGGWAYEVFMLWVAPAILNIVYISIFFNWLPHRPHTSCARYRDSAVFLLPRPVHWLATRLDMFQTYHLMHHLFPRIPFYRLEKAFHEMRPLLEAEGAPIHDFQRQSGPAPA